MGQALLEAFAHATEDLEKVTQALLNLVPPELRDAERVSYEEVKGHYDNPIIILRLKLQGGEVLALLKFLAENMSDGDKIALGSTLDLRLDEEGYLHMRFDKASAFNGEVRLAHRGEAVKVKAHLRPQGPKRLESFLAEVGLIK
ncbi:MAG: hypothetical protein N3H31_00445 [Candidatus Nezhaarchaeota archaeon]|nr:hypothetical protein [Candidatus Nezhaarchaeota archaeon]